MTTKFFKIVIMALAITFVATSCGKGSSVDGALSQIEKAVDKVEKNKTSMTEADWKALEKELEQPAKVLNEALESDQVSALKKIKISVTMLRYATVIGEAALHTASDSLKVKIEESHLTDSISVVNEQLQDILESDEVKQALQELQKAAEGLNIGK